MINRYMPATTLATFGLAAGIVGLVTNISGIAYLGVLSILGSVPPLIISATRTAARVSAHQLAEADQAGYRRAMDHVARGLMNPPPATPLGGPGLEETIQQQVHRAAGEVIPLRPHIDHRKAQ